MPKKYHLKLDLVIKQIAKIYADYDDSEVEKGKTAISRLKPVIHAEVNKMLDFLEQKRNENKNLSQELEKEENARILKFLNDNIRF